VNRPFFLLPLGEGWDGVSQFIKFIKFVKFIKFIKKEEKACAYFSFPLGNNSPWGRLGWGFSVCKLDKLILL